LWPTGSNQHFDSLTTLIKAGISAVKEADSSIKIMLHIALGGQNAESRAFIDTMLANNVPFDLIGESYYPKWHGTIIDLKNNLTDLAARYNQDIIVAEYSEHKKEVNDIAFNLADQKIKGTFIWEPLNTWEFVFDKNGSTNSLIELYDEISKMYKIH